MHVWVDPRGFTLTAATRSARPRHRFRRTPTALRGSPRCHGHVSPLHPQTHGVRCPWLPRVFARRMRINTFLAVAVVVIVSVDLTLNAKDTTSMSFLSLSIRNMPKSQTPFCLHSSLPLGFGEYSVPPLRVICLDDSELMIFTLFFFPARTCRVEV